MTTIGIYVDGPNVERGLYDAGDRAILERVGSLLVEYAQEQGEVVEAKVFLDEATQWRYTKTREDYEMNGFVFLESKSFKHIDPHTGAFMFGKSLTDPSMHCAIVDRLHDLDCPQVFFLVTGDKDITVALDYIHAHGRTAQVLGEANSISGFLVSKCEALGFGCHVLQLIARKSQVMEGHWSAGPSPETSQGQDLRLTDPSGKPVNMHKYVLYRNDRSNQKNPNNIAYWRSRGFKERPLDWERRAKQDLEEEK